MSRCLTSAEKNYTTTEKELLAIVFAVQKFRVYLIGVSFLIVTDHQCLTFLKSANFQNARITRWSMLLMQYNYTIAYCRGIDNVVADFFSRHPEGKFRKENRNKIIISSLHKCFLPIDNPEIENSLLTIALLEVDRELAQSFKELKELQKGDPRIAKYMEKNYEKTEKIFF